MALQSHLARADGILRRRPSAVLGAAYLLAIPIFGLAYLLMPQDFYSSTARFEANLPAVNRDLLDRFEDAMKAGFRDAKGQGAELGDLILADLRVVPGVPGQPEALGGVILPLNPPQETTSLAFSMWVQIAWEDGSTINITNHKYDVIIPTPSWTERYGDWNYRYVVVVDAKPPDSVPFIVPEPSFDPYSMLQAPATYGDRTEGILRLPNSTSAELTDYWNALNGQATGLTVTLPRMMYLSAVTITTVGYGDIVPITDRARLLVAVEAVYGIVIAGLYLASLATSRPSRRTG